MKILHLVAGSIHSGAAKGAYWLHLEMLNQKVESRMFLQIGNPDPEKGVYIISSTKLGKLKRLLYTHMDAFLIRFYPKRKKHLFSPGLIGFEIINSSLYKWADIIHLHWINQGMISVFEIGRITKPIVWTLRDMGAFTGGCHHAFDCEKYISYCGSCPHLGSIKQHDLSTRVQLNKIKYYKNNIHPVAISSWLKKCADRSTILKEYNTTVICNGIDISLFKPYKKETARAQFNLPMNKKIILLGASNIHDIYKGFEKFRESLAFLKNKGEYLFLFFGSSEYSSLEKLNINYFSYGTIDDSTTLAKLYSAGDVFVAPSIAEAFGKTLAESLACGTPVVCFDATGPKDIVEHKVSGYKAIPFEPSDLAKGINWVLENEERLVLLSKSSREVATKKFSIIEIAKKYLNLYSDIVKKNK